MAVVHGSQVNLKITQPGDLELAEFYLQPTRSLISAGLKAGTETMETRIGFGWDSHAFKAGVPLRIGGMTLDHPEGLAGSLRWRRAAARNHRRASWAPWPLAISAASSLRETRAGKTPTPQSFVNLAIEELHNAGFRIVNVDTTLVLTAPKIGPVAGEMRSCVADLLGIEMEQVSIKAKTPEGLGSGPCSAVPCDCPRGAFDGNRRVEKA